MLRTRACRGGAVAAAAIAAMACRQPHGAIAAKMAAAAPSQKQHDRSEARDTIQLAQHHWNTAGEGRSDGQNIGGERSAG